MKKILALLLLVAAACSPVRHVDVTSRHNYYERHRVNTFTSPTWVPGYGIVLQTHIVPYRFVRNYYGKDMSVKRPARKH